VSRAFFSTTARYAALLAPTSTMRTMSVMMRLSAKSFGV